MSYHLFQCFSLLQMVLKMRNGKDTKKAGVKKNDGKLRVFCVDFSSLFLNFFVPPLSSFSLSSVAVSER